MQSKKQLLTMFALLMAAGAAVEGQTATATLTGTVKDPSAAAIAGARITVTNVATNAVRQTVTDAEGKYSVPSLLPGRYSVEAQAAGFSRYLAREVVLQVDQRGALDISLAVGDVSESITVEEETPLLQAGRVDVGQVIDTRRIVELPLNGRQFLNLAGLVAGVNTRVLAGSASEFIVGQRGKNLVSANGSRNFSNSFLLDGAFNTDGDFNTYVISPPVDSIQEFKVQSSTYSAEFGRAGGGQINVITKSGGNQFHGSAYEFLRNDKLDAKNFFDRGGAPIPPYRQNQFGATFGGPILIPKLYNGRDKTFVFGTYEGFRVRQAQTALSTVANDAARAGVFPASPVLFDPATTRRLADGRVVRDPLPGNRVPENRFNPIARGYLALMPAQNLPGNASNFLDNRSITSGHNQFSVRGDQRISNANNFFARYSLSKETDFQPRSFPGLGEDLAVKGQQLTISDTHVAGPRTVNDFRFGFNRFYHAALPENAFRNNYVDKLGIQNVSTAPIDWGLPLLNITGLTGFGDNVFSRPSTIRNNTVQWVDTLVHTTDKHTITAGIEIRRFQFNNTSSVLGRGQFAFQGVFTNDPAVATSSGAPFADFLLGLPRTIEFGSPTDLTQVYFRQTAWGLFVQDDFRIAPRLTLNLGVRYEYSPPLGEKFGNVLNVELAGLNVPRRIVAPGNRVADLVARPYRYADGTHDYPDRMVNADRNDIAPRVGIAWRAKDRTVIRTGYGIYYDQDIANKYFDITRNVPRIFRINRTSGTQFPELDFRNSIGSGADIIPNAFGIPKDVRTGYLQHWNFAVQQQLGATFTLETAYVGSKGTKLSTFEEHNAAWPPGTSSPQTRRPHPLLSTVFMFANNTNTSYHSFQTRAEKRWSKGLSFLTSYVFAKAIDDGVPPRGRPGSGEEAPSIPFDRKLRERGISGTNVRHRTVSSVTYDMPFGPGKRFASGVRGPARLLTEGWQTSFILGIQSGPPFSIRAQGDRLNAGRSSFQHANAVPGVEANLPESERNTRRYFNAGAFANPPALVIGTLGRNTMTGPGYFNLDVSVLKDFRIKEDHRLEFRCEFFNLPNHPNWGLPGNTVGNPDFGVISSAAPSRQIQLALKYLF